MVRISIVVAPALTFQLLGCGTSTGVPLPACRCAVCLSAHPRNKRLRCSGIIKIPEERDSAGLARRILIDTSTDLRQQALAYDIRRIDSVLFTHAHADHILGLEDLRAFNFIQQQVIPCYATTSTNSALRRFFSYIFSPAPDYQGGGLAKLTLHDIEALSPITLFGITILPFTVMHGRMPVLGFRINDFAYATDCNHVPPATMEALRGVKTLILDGLRMEPQPTHFTIPQACDVAKKIGAEKTYLTHMTHTVDYEVINPTLPTGIELGYDGLEFDIS